MLTAAEARWENEGGALDEEEPGDLHHGDFTIDPVPPFRLDLSSDPVDRGSNQRVIEAVTTHNPITHGS